MADASQTRQNLIAALDKVRKRIQQVRERNEHINETQTKTSLIGPILGALGWDTEDLDEVSMEYRHKSQDNPVDYALFLHKSPLLFVEAKALDTNLDDHKWRSQAVNYANAAGVEWCVLTDGDRYCIYNTHAPVEVEQKLFRSISLTDMGQTDFTLSTLELISKEQMGEQVLRVLWRAHFVDRRVKQALDDIWEDDGFVRLVRKRAEDLTAGDIRDSLKRADIRIQFPAVPIAHPPEVPTTPPTVDAQAATVTDAVSQTKSPRVCDLLSAGLVKAGDRWRFLPVHGPAAECEVTADGHLLANGQKHDTPSGAGRSITGWKAFDGWKLWECQCPDGQWRPVDSLRQLFTGAASAPAPSDPEADAPAPSGTQVFRWLANVQDDGVFTLHSRYLPDETKSFQVTGQLVPPEGDFGERRAELLEQIYNHIAPLFPGLPYVRVRAKAWAGVHKVYPPEVYGRKE